MKQVLFNWLLLYESDTYFHRIIFGYFMFIWQNEQWINILRLVIADNLPSGSVRTLRHTGHFA